MASAGEDNILQLWEMASTLGLLFINAFPLTLQSYRQNIFLQILLLLKIHLSTNWNKYTHVVISKTLYVLYYTYKCFFFLIQMGGYSNATSFTFFVS